MESMNYDITILGAGPAGLCAALRFVELGYRVALTEACRFPRPQIGESLSPGIYSLFDYLGVGHLLDDARYLRELPSRIIWEEETAQGQLLSKDGFLVDRAKLDAALLAEAIARGIDFFPGAGAGIDPGADAGIKPGAVAEMPPHLYAGRIFPAGIAVPRARVVLDARGRRSVKAADRLLTAPSSLALWTQVPAAVMPYESGVEALPEGWLWGAPVPGGEYRVMAFVDASTVKVRGTDAVLRGMVAESRLFAAILPKLAAGRLQACPVLHYIHKTPWRDDYIRVGEAAFTIDPLSSSGVEKAMRHALQAVIAVNTLLKGDNPALAQSFYEDKLLRSVADHRAWTCTYYGKAWPGPRYPFWKTRSEFRDLPATGTFLDRLRRPKAAAHLPPPEAAAHLSHPESAPHLPAQGLANVTHDQAHVNVTQVLHEVWERAPFLSSLLSYDQACCVVDDRLQLRTGINHPRLHGEMVYLGGVEVKPLLDMVPSVRTFGELLYRWSNVVPAEQAGKMLAFLWEKEILC
jgi:flavin-dependent dehydrogenase